MKKEDLDYRNSASKIKNKVSVYKYYFDQLPKDLRRLSFTVSNAESINQIQMIKKTLENAQKEGLSFIEWRNSLDHDAVRGISKARQETIFRTNMATSYATSTRYNSATSRVTPYLMFSSVNDSRSRPAHKELSGIIRKANDSFWDTHTPPLGYNCRCKVIPMSKEEAERRGGVTRIDLDKIPSADKGFGESSLGSIQNGVDNLEKTIKEKLPLNSPYRKKFIDAQNNIESSVQVWWNKVKEEFEV